MAFRDSFDQCPRCGITLEDAQSARGCARCGGVFVEEPILAEMILQMLPPPPRIWGPLQLSAVKREGAVLACPQCTEAMTATEIHDVELDRCPKQHGVWFDPDELRITLYRVADPKRLPPFGEMLPLISPPTPANPAPPPPPPKVESGAPQILFSNLRDGSNTRLQLGVIKIGRINSSHLRIDDPKLDRMHAIIEATREQVIVIDLGSRAGTFVNGKRITKTTLKAGDVMKLGDTELVIAEIN